MHSEPGPCGFAPLRASQSSQGISSHSRQENSTPRFRLWTEKQKYNPYPRLLGYPLPQYNLPLSCPHSYHRRKNMLPAQYQGHTLVAHLWEFPCEFLKNTSSTSPGNHPCPLRRHYSPDNSSHQFAMPPVGTFHFYGILNLELLFSTLHSSYTARSLCNRLGRHDK